MRLYLLNDAFEAELRAVPDAQRSETGLLELSATPQKGRPEFLLRCLDLLLVEHVEAHQRPSVFPRHEFVDKLEKWPKAMVGSVTDIP